MNTTDTIISRGALRRATDWIDGDGRLPDGWTLMVGGSGSPQLVWHSPTALDRPEPGRQDAVRDRLEYLYGPGEDHGTAFTVTTWTEWPAEGDRPSLTVFGVTVRAAHVATGA